MNEFVLRAVDLVDDDDDPDADVSALRTCWAITCGCRIRPGYICSWMVSRIYNRLKERCEAQHSIYAVTRVLVVRSRVRSMICRA